MIQAIIGLVGPYTKDRRALKVPFVFRWRCVHNHTVLFCSLFFKKYIVTLRLSGSVAWSHPVHQRVMGSIVSQRTYPGFSFRFGLVDTSLPLFLSLKSVKNISLGKDVKTTTKKTRAPLFHNPHLNKAMGHPCRMRSPLVFKDCCLPFSYSYFLFFFCLFVFLVF